MAVTVCPSIEKPSAREKEDEIESDVYEDPAVLYEDTVENPDDIDLDNYLVCTQPTPTLTDNTGLKLRVTPVNVAQLTSLFSGSV